MSADSNVRSGMLSGQEAGAPIHGEAALLLVESLLHGLIAKSVISVPEALDILTVAIDAHEESSDYPLSSCDKVSSLLRGIHNSLSYDGL